MLTAAVKELATLEMIKCTFLFSIVYADIQNSYEA